MYLVYRVNTTMIYISGILRYQVDFQVLDPNLDDFEDDDFDLDDY